MKKLVVILIVVLLVCSKAWGVGLRRPISPSQPMWLVHVDNSYGEDAKKCIDAVPADVLPYVVFNLAVTNSDNYSTLVSYLDVCKQNNVWCMVQCSAGTRNSMDDSVINTYEQLYRNYPNLIGYNFCEQNWGLDATTLTQRLELFSKLIELGVKYGGYLYVNDSQSLSNNPINTIAKMKAWGRYAELTKKYSDHFIFGDKTTMGYGYYDNESAALGMYLSGHAGHYAVRYDQYAWSYSGHGQVFGTEVDGTIPNSLAWFSCPEAAMGISIVEHVMMTGATVIDGPEIPIVTCLIDGRQTPSFKNMICDIVRKIADETIHIPTRQQVLDRTKVCMVLNNFNTVGDDTPLYDGLYQMDGHRTANKTWLKKSGRYATIPTVAVMDDAAGFDIVVAQKTSNLYTDRWATTDAKVTELNALYPEISTGDMYVGRMQDDIYAYNPYLNTNQTATSTIPLQYNSCTNLQLEYTPHTFSVINESTSGLQIYLNNYRTDKDPLWTQYPSTSDGDGLARMTQSSVQEYIKSTFIDNPNHDALRTSVIKVTGCMSKPAYTWADRGSHSASSVSDSYADGTLTLTIQHNGPLDISIPCQGTGTSQSAAAHNSIETPASPVSDVTVYQQHYDFNEYADGDVLLTATSSNSSGTAQIVKYTGNDRTSMVLNPGQNGTGTNKIGVLTLGRFGSESDYSVVWKEYATGQTKGGILLRGTMDYDGANPGVMSGYYFQTNTNISGSTTKMAIRKIANASDGTTAIGNGSSGEKSVTAPASGQPRWYRATANGTTLTFDYSDDGTTWTNVLTRSDADYTQGMTQLLWGLNTNVTTSYYDDIYLVTADHPRHIEVTLTDAGYTSFSNVEAVSFTGTGLEAFVVTSTGDGVVNMTSVTSAPANTGLILKGNAGSYSLPVVSTASTIETNLLVATSQSPYLVGSTDNIYVLANKDNGVGFYKASAGFSVRMGSAYLPLSSSAAAPARSFLNINTGSTGIETIRTAQMTGVYYSLSGIPTCQPTRGIYILNGKKVIVK